jgi:hypothetical protein
MQALENFFNQLLVNIQIYYDTATTGVSTLTLGKTLALIGSSIGLSLLVTLVYLFVNRKKAYSTKSLFTILLMGPIVSVIVIAISAMMDDRIHDEEYVLQTYDYPILAKVPDLLTTGSKSYSYYRHYKSSDSTK